MKKMLMCLMGIGFALHVCGQTKPITMDLNGSWKFNKGDDPKWAKAGFKATDWADMTLPNWDWEAGYNGYGWFKKEVVLPAKETYLFNLGQVDDDCDVYFNGTLLKLYISSRPNKDNTDTTKWGQWLKYRSYYIPKELINAGQSNSIALRVWNTEGGQGGVRYGNIFVSSTVFYNQLPISLEGNWIKTDGSNAFLAGFYNNKVAYKNQIWDYQTIKEENGVLTITLTANGKEEQLVAIKDKKSEKYLIGEDKASAQLCSVVETYKSDYATTTKNFIKTTPLPGKATFSGYIKGYAPKYGNLAGLELRGLYNLPGSEKTIAINPDGTFSTELDVSGPMMATLHLPGISLGNPAYVEANKLTFQVLDMEEFKIRMTPEYYGRERLTVFMGDVTLESKLILYLNWLSAIEGKDRKVWDNFILTARQYASGNKVYDWQMNNVSAYIAENYKKYDDVEALRLAKLWSAKTVYSAPENHYYNNTLTIILKDLGEDLEGLQYLVNALYGAEKEKNQPFVENYKEKIKVYIADMLK